MIGLKLKCKNTFSSPEETRFYKSFMTSKAIFLLIVMKSTFYLGFLQKKCTYQNPTVAVITLLSPAYQDFPEQEYKGARAPC